MINLNKKDAVTDAVKSILSQEEIDVNARTKDDIGGRKKSAQKDDVGPASDSKTTKVRFHPGPKNEEVVTEGEKTEKVLAKSKPVSVEKTEGPEPRETVDTNADKQNKSLKGFKEKFEGHSIYDQMINEVLAKDASAGAWIHDFVHSDNPKFAGKSKEQRKKMALGAYYAKQNEEVESVEEGVVDAVKKVAKKVGEVLGGPDDEGHKKDLQRKMGAKPEQQHGKKSMAKYNEETEQVEEGWDDMVKAAKDSVKSGPKPSGGSGVKQGTRYGGGKQTSKPEQDDEKKEVKEEKEEQPAFDPPYKKKPSDVKDKSGATHTPMSRAKNLARLAMTKMKKELGHKGK